MHCNILCYDVPLLSTVAQCESSVCKLAPSLLNEYFKVQVFIDRESSEGLLGGGE